MQCGPAWTPLALKVWRGLHPLKLALVQKCTGNSSTGTLNIGSWPKLNTPLKPQCTLRHQAIRGRPPGAKKIVVVVHFGDQRFACGAPSSPATCLSMPSHARNGACHPLPPLQRPTDLRCLSPQVSLVVRSYRGRDVPAREHLTSGERQLEHTLFLRVII